MKKFVPMDACGIFTDADRVVRVDSRFVARDFGKKHDKILRLIRSIPVSEACRLEHFVEATYKDMWGYEHPRYLLSRDGFAFVARAFLHKEEIVRVSEKFYKRFDKAKAFVQDLEATQADLPELNKAIEGFYKDPIGYHYAREFDMIFEAVLGMNSRKWRKTHHIEPDMSLRPFLTEQHIHDIEELQRLDVNLLLATPKTKFQERRQAIKKHKKAPQEETA